MSQALDLLNGATEEEISKYLSDPAAEPHIVVGADRFITVPDVLKRLGVQFDHNMETVTFDCPRYWDGLDMSQMKIYINYMRPDKAKDMDLAKEVTVDEADSNIMHFKWTISSNVTLVKGNLSFLICVKKTDEDGMENNHWNSELCQECYISEGLECSESIISENPDIITDLLVRMESAEFAVSSDEVTRKINNALATEPTTQETIKSEVSKYLKTDVDLVGTVEEVVDGALSDVSDIADEAASVAGEALTVARGKNRARVFLTTADMYAWISDPANIGQAQVGDNMYIVDVNVPDWWVSKVLAEGDSDLGYFYELAQLETQKVDLTTINNSISDINNKISAIQSKNTEQDNKISAIQSKNTEQDNRLTSLDSKTALSTATVLLTGITSNEVMSIDASKYKQLLIRATFADGGSNCDQVIDCQVLYLIGTMRVTFTNGLLDSSAFYGRAMMEITMSSVQLLDSKKGNSISEIRYSVRGYA